jgi:hypothetical protein
MTKYSKSEIAEAQTTLRKWIKLGDTVYTVLDHVSRSGMCRHIRLQLIKCEDGEPRILHPNWNAARVLGYSMAKRDGLVVGGCGMDMGFHIVHSLGYALFGQEAEHGEGAEANALRKAIYEADKYYWHQCKENKNPPDWTKPDRWWFGASGYALKHQWI